MKSPTPHGPVEWARRVNHTWIVHGGLDRHAEEWIEHLAWLADGRLERSCAAAKAMCEMRQPLDDPKPWFYAGLFSLATPGEARGLLADHRVTRACVPSLAGDEEVRCWESEAGPETLELLGRLREGLRRISETAASSRESQ